MTPYEIRLELLKMAQTLVTDEYSYNTEASEEQWRTQVDAAKIAGTTSPDYPQLPPFPTEADIVKKAEQLNLFVSQTPATIQPEIKVTKKHSS
jgi:hypothetical protein